VHSSAMPLRPPLTTTPYSVPTSKASSHVKWWKPVSYLAAMNCHQLAARATLVSSIRPVVHPIL
jgi:hypothetical protein